jgi:hypothetical protein
MASLMADVMLMCQPCMRKNGRGTRCQRTSPTAANGDISRDRIKCLESRLADLERRDLDNSAFCGTQGENWNRPKLSRVGPKPERLRVSKQRV